MAEADPDISIKGAGFLRKQNLISKQFVLKKNQKILWRKLQNGKKKNEKDEIENILSKHVSTSL